MQLLFNKGMLFEYFEYIGQSNLEVSSVDLIDHWVVSHDLSIESIKPWGSLPKEEMSRSERQTWNIALLRSRWQSYFFQIVLFFRHFQRTFHKVVIEEKIP